MLPFFNAKGQSLRRSNGPLKQEKLATGRLIETHHKRTFDLRKGIWGHSKYYLSLKL